MRATVFRAPRYLYAHGRRGCAIGLGGLSGWRDPVRSILSRTYVNAIKHLTGGDRKPVGCGCLPLFRAHYRYLSSAKINQSPRWHGDEQWMQLEAQMAGKDTARPSDTEISFDLDLMDAS